METAHAASAARSWLEGLEVLEGLDLASLAPELPPWAEDKKLRTTIAAVLVGVACAALLARETLVRTRTRRLISAYGHAHAD